MLYMLLILLGLLGLSVVGTACGIAASMVVKKIFKIEDEMNAVIITMILFIVSSLISAAATNSYKNCGSIWDCTNEEVSDASR